LARESFVSEILESTLNESGKEKTHFKENDLMTSSAEPRQKEKLPVGELYLGTTPKSESF
jgi:hypothetical protein